VKNLQNQALQSLKALTQHGERVPHGRGRCWAYLVRPCLCGWLLLPRCTLITAPASPGHANKSGDDGRDFCCANNLYAADSSNNAWWSFNCFVYL